MNKQEAAGCLGLSISSAMHLGVLIQQRVLSTPIHFTLFTYYTLSFISLLY